MKTIRLTMAQALARFLCAQKTEINGKITPVFGGVWAIFGHGNVSGLGEALYHVQEDLPTYRAHNEQGMAHAAIAFAKASNRRRMMACTTSIGPGATNMVTAAALAHVNRLPILLLPGDVFANRNPDPVLQQIECFGDGTVSANDCFKAVSRYFDRITRPEQIIPALNRAMAVLTDPADCGPVTLALCQDTQAEAYDYPESFFAEKIWRIRQPLPDLRELDEALAALKIAQKPLIIAGGGVHYAQATEHLRSFAEKHAIPIAETQAGKSALPHDHPLNMGAIGVTGTSAANTLAEQADLVLAVGTRLQDFTTGSWSLFQNPDRKFVGINIQTFDATKHRSLPVVGDAAVILELLDQKLADWSAPSDWTLQAAAGFKQWQLAADRVTAASSHPYPSDAQVIGAVQRHSTKESIVVCAAGGLPGELHKLWQAQKPGGYHVEYGYSCMGYEIAGGLGVKMADPDREVIVMVGDGSYLMMNSEIATSVLLDLPLTIVLLDNRGYGCINRLQQGTGGESFNNLLQHTHHQSLPDIDFRAHAQSLGAEATKVSGIAELEKALAKARASNRTNVIVIDTDPLVSTAEGGCWWDVAVPEVSVRKEVVSAHENYLTALKKQRIGD
ncbi:3D-(3,5/4)-trihydroxycyclohexane-1,2-dione acylhydrolase (decyclizing) [Kiloniella laminariae]|uniref:3D-(3,5/4)-trihydroxycyclohexane-1,2-dione acylhydrolase (Decyclizing) n=1 Tax=Kiloniella laminariae TaxID=454162 RepID=A0ABT4LGJ1_9PROT|nr:3D-(3,5/4)-trihydroxycyclohexane-1,2-dione acylhydrolase (decyclizing) [Kiloniella laminariae]MCZ4280221.1 3D-(3,5/4)-trihydroxycyclohexane-1,2-dione acylhydrolase (decyclizing) [Kiloniella laminariae]